MYLHIPRCNASFKHCSPAIDALIVGIETQAEYLASKKTWTRKIVIITDGESPIEIEDWEATVHKMDALDISLTVVFVFPLSPEIRLLSLQRRGL
jgi:hypothetical protein